MGENRREARAKTQAQYEENVRRDRMAYKMGYEDSEDKSEADKATLEKVMRTGAGKKGTTEALLRGAKMMGANSMYSLLSGKAANKQTITVQSVRSQAGNKKQWSLFG